MHKGHRLVGCEAKGEGIQKHPKRFLKQAGAVLFKDEATALKL
jgi:hypothetical protein